MKSFILVLCIGLLAASGLAEASDAGRRAAAERLLKTVHMKETLSKTMERMTDMQIRGNPQLRPMRDIMLKFERKYMGYDSLKGELVGLYARDFTEKELNDILAFYGTPTGRKAIRLMPQLMTDAARIGLKRVRDHQEELRSMIQERLEQIKAENGGGQSH